MHRAYSTRLALYFGGLLAAFVGLLMVLWVYGIPVVGEGGIVGQRLTEARVQMEQRADFLRRLLVLQLDKRRGEVRALVHNEALGRMLAAPATPDATARLQRHVQQWLNGHPADFQHVRVLRGRTGTIAWGSNPGEIGALFPDRGLLQRALQPGAQELILPAVSPAGKPAIAWVRQLRTEPGSMAGELLGVVVAYTEVQDLLDEVLRPVGLSLAEAGQTVLYDSQQRVIAAVPTRDVGANTVRLDAEVAQGFEGSLLKATPSGEQYLAVYRSIALGGTHAWTMAQLRAEADIHQETRRRLLRALAVCLVAAVVLGAVMWLTVRLATRRLMDVSAAFERLARGDLSARLVTRPRDSLEISTIIESFNRLAATVQRSNATLEHEVLERTAELQTERDRAQGYLDVAAIMLLVLDTQGHIALVNRKGAEQLGYPAAQLLGMDWFLHFVPTGTRESLRHQFQEVMAGQRVLETRFEYQIVDANGRTRLIAWHAALLRDRDGRPTGMLSSGQDVTATRAAQAELRIAAIAFESQEAHMVCDANWTILRVNPAFTRITGYSAQDAVGKMPQKLLGTGRTPADLYLTMGEALQRDSRWEGEVWDRRKNGEVFPAWLQVTAVRDDDHHVTHFVVSMNDITERKAAEEQIRNLAFYDPLTNLPNRRLLLDRLDVALATCARHPRMGALLFVDLDNFKALNDTMGHDIGDLLLQQVAERLKSCVREGDTVARLGGDEFVIMLEDLANNPIDAATQVEAVGEKILHSLGRSYVLRGHSHRSTPSIGVTLFGDRVESIEEPLKRADMAMYQSKAAGRNTLRFFDPKMQAAVSTRVALETDLRQAIEQHQLVLYYQPQVQSRSDGSLRVVGAEALVRWRHPERGMVSPADFIPLAEETGLIVPLGGWVIETACQQLAAWQGHPELGELTIAVNVSAKQFLQTSFVSHVRHTLERTGAQPPKLKIELTESVLVADVEEVAAKMVELQSWGVGFALDDFGTGYSSLAYLKRLPLDTLKIDQSFVRDVFEDANDAAIARMVVVLGHSLGLGVIAEGVETLEQRYYLAQQGCHMYQGYLFGKPMAADAFQQWVIERGFIPA